MFHQTLFCVVITVLCITAVDSEDPLGSNEAEDRNIIKNIQTFMEYIGQYVFPDIGKLLGRKGSAGLQAEAIADHSHEDDVLSFDFAKVDQKAALSPEEVVEQILKVEQELDLYNDNSEL